MSDPGYSIWPLACTWNGEAFEPLPRFHNACNARLVVGHVYTVEEVKARSLPSHRHYFAAIREAWQNLPDEAAIDFPTTEHLRKYALIKTGYRDERRIVASSKGQARKLAAFVRPMDEFAVVTREDNVVTVFTARSQDMKSMNKEEFSASKDAVLDLLASMIEVKRRELEKAAA
jgi:hypothetical protein